MKAPITPAQAWAAIAEASGWDVATKLERSQAERIAELERESETNAKAYGLAIVERDNLHHELKVAQEGWRCECSTDDACRFARERDAKAERIKELESECEVERLRLAACGVAALGYFDGCKDEYKSASLDDVLRLNKRCADLRAELGDLPEAQAEMLAEIKQLRAELAAIDAAEPVLVVEKEPDYWSGGHFHEGSKSHIKSTKVWRLPIGTKLFTRPMPAQIIGLQDVHDAITADPTLAESNAEFDESQFKSVEDLIAHLNKLNSYRDRTLEALSKYKGAK